MKFNNMLVAKVAVPLLGLCLSGQLVAQNEASDSGDWNYGAEVYLWGASVGLDTASGDRVDVGFTDLVKDIQMGAMGTLVAEKGKWRFGADFIYLDADDNANKVVPPGIKLDDAELAAWLVSPVVGYEFASTDASKFRVYGGARYLWTETTLTLVTVAPLPPEKLKEKEKATLLDGVLGLHGYTEFNERWYASYLADVGTGDSDVTYHALAAINYRFDKFDGSLGYRYIRWELDNELIDELDFSGFFAGAKFYF